MDSHMERSWNIGERLPGPSRVGSLLLLLAILLPVPFLSGCRSCEALEADNRKKETENRELRERLEHVEAVNNGLLREMHGEHATMAPGAPASASKVPPEQAPAVYGLKEIAIGRGTGGIDDHHAGDEALQVVIEPHDTDNHTIKAPGTVHITVLEIRPEGLKVPIGSWEISPDKLRRAWKPGLWSTGYVLTFPWQKCPTSNKIRVVARFTLSDGRVFEADKDVTIKPPKSAPRPVPGPPIEEKGQGPSLGPEEDPLLSPMPRATEPPPLAPAGAWNRGGRAAMLMPPVPR